MKERQRNNMRKYLHTFNKMKVKNNLSVGKVEEM